MNGPAMPSANDQAPLVDQLSERLSQSYEEINVLFRLSHLLGTDIDPPGTIRIACHEIARVLPFAWLAIWFNDSHEVAPSLCGALEYSTRLPCHEQQFRSIAGDLCGRYRSDQGPHVLVPGDNQLATLTGAEVLAEPIVNNGKCIGILVGGNKGGDDADIASGEIQFLNAAANFLAVFHENILRFAQQRGQYLGMLRALSATIDAKDSYTRGHSDRVAILTAKLAGALALPAMEVEQFRIAGQLHDIGKIGVPEAVLCKVGRLTTEEFAEIKKHPEIGFGILKDIPGMDHILPGVLHHHERWDGQGYPHGLAGEQIPLVARCIALADTFDAMSSVRSYRQPMNRTQVEAEIHRVAGSQFNAELAALFISLDFSDFDSMLASAKARASGM
jgi:GAF domain-containing protein